MGGIKFEPLKKEKLVWAAQLARAKLSEEVDGISESEIAKQFREAMAKFPVLMQAGMREATKDQHL